MADVSPASVCCENRCEWFIRQDRCGCVKRSFVAMVCPRSMLHLHKAAVLKCGVSPITNACMITNTCMAPIRWHRPVHGIFQGYLVRGVSPKSVCCENRYEWFIRQDRCGCVKRSFGGVVCPRSMLRWVAPFGGSTFWWQHLLVAASARCGAFRGVSPAECVPDHKRVHGTY
jgi:hypothetical protein